MCETMKIVTFIGTRPEAIKLAPIIKLFKKDDSFKTYICTTGQHKEMVEQILKDFKLRPDFDLQVMTHNQSLAELSSALFISIDKILETTNPNWVLVQGDTTSAFIGGLCSYYRKINVAHVEAGLRSHDFWIPFPEEFNRKAISLLTKIHFAPTENARQNLIKEGIDNKKICVTGNTVIDALLWIKKRMQNFPPRGNSLINSLISQKKKYILITGHRRESFGKGFENICRALRELAWNFRDFFFVYPVHLNPNVRNPVFRLLKDSPNILLIDPLDYKNFIWAMWHCEFILTDSGGIQEEAPSLGKYVLVMRDVTERTEGIKAGTSILVGTSREKIVENVSSFLTQYKTGKIGIIDRNPYGDGKASHRIYEFFKEELFS